MKKQMIAGGLMLASLGAASAQGLYDIAPNDDALESLPIKFAAGVDVGYNDNVTPTAVKGSSGYEESSANISAYVGAAWVSITPQTTWDIYGRIGGTYYFDAPSVMASDGYVEGRLGVNWAHRVSERLRFTSRNFVAYQQEPEYNYGIGSVDFQTDPYFVYRTDNSVGYRWTERFATYTGFTFSGIAYDSATSNNDRQTWTVYNQFRYRVSEQTVWTLDYRYSTTSAEGTAADSDSHYLLAGIEHRFSPNTVGVLKAGAQFRDSDDGSSDTSPFFEAALRSRVNEQCSVRLFTRYSMEEYGTSFTGYSYDGTNTFRVGASADYALSPDLTLFGGLNYVMTNYQDASNPTISDLDQDLWNAYIGLTYKINDALSVTASYNYTDSSASGGTATASDSRDYSQNRASLGLRFEF